LHWHLVLSRLRPEPNAVQGYAVINLWGCNVYSIINR
jgi:hypothetical protein